MSSRSPGEIIRFGREEVSHRRENFEKILDASIADLFADEYHDTRKISRRPIGNQRTATTTRVVKRKEPLAVTHKGGPITKPIATTGSLKHQIEVIFQDNAEALGPTMPQTQDNGNHPSDERPCSPVPVANNDTALPKEKANLDIFSSLRSFSRQYLKRLEATQNDCDDDDFLSEIRGHSAYLDALAATAQLREPVYELRENLLLPVDVIERQVIVKVCHITSHPRSETLLTNPSLNDFSTTSCAGLPQSTPRVWILNYLNSNF